MSTRPWYKRFPSDFIAGTMNLTLEQKGAYSMVLDLIYDRGGPIPDDSQWIARVCGCSTRKWNKIRADLIEHGKIHVTNGLISNFRAEKDAFKNDFQARKLSESGAKGGLKSAEKRAKSKQTNGLDQKGLENPGKQSRSQSLEKEKIYKKEKSNYRWTGRVIRLNDEDYQSWQKCYSAIPDLDAELKRIDDRLATEGKTKNWFVATSAMLAHKHQHLLAEHQSNPKPKASFTAA